MTTRTTEKLKNGQTRETTKYNNGAQKSVTYKPGALYNRVTKVERKDSPKR